jgi:hypothetical protein
MKLMNAAVLFVGVVEGFQQLAGVGYLCQAGVLVGWLTMLCQMECGGG